MREHPNGDDPRLRVHDLRHACATRALRRRVDPVRLMRHMGWKTLSIVQRYGHLVDDDLPTIADAFDDRS